MCWLSCSTSSSHHVVSLFKVNHCAPGARYSPRALSQSQRGEELRPAISGGAMCSFQSLEDCSQLTGKL